MHGSHLVGHQQSYQTQQHCVVAVKKKLVNFGSCRKNQSQLIPEDSYRKSKINQVKMMRIILPFLSLIVSVSAGSLLMDTAGGLRLKIPSISTAQGVVAVISSPGTTSLLTASDDLLSLEAESPPCLTCRGATLSGTSAAERSALATSSLVSGAIMVDGITEGDVEAGWRNSRHARTLTALFRARITLDTSFKQTLILCVKGEVDVASESALKTEVRALFDATAAETEGKANFNEFYDVLVVSVTNAEEAKEVSELFVVGAHVYIYVCMSRA
jgi:hypothetical protein